MLYRAGIRLAAVGNNKAKLWLTGRQQLFHHIQQVMQQNTAPVIWMHCSSLGEFEQGRPLLELLRQQYPRHKILLTFFSPSGYESQKNNPVADFIFYLPMDSRQHAKQFLALVKPTIALFVKYEFWYYYLQAIHRQQIPLLLVSGVFRPGQPFFHWYGGLHRRMLSYFDLLLVQDEASKQLLDVAGFSRKTIVTGDTRYDRVLDIASKYSPVPYIKAFCKNDKIIVAGSTWSGDESFLKNLAARLPQSSRLIIAPHEIDAAHITALQTTFPGALLYSSLQNGGIPDARVLIIDNIGMLSRLYHDATIAYIGGGFTRDGIHNVLEAAVYGIPVIFGPNYHKYAEAKGLIAAGGARSFQSQAELNDIVQDLFSNNDKYRQMQQAAEKFIHENKGATSRILGWIQEKRLLTN